jgi:hypothetical protein
MGHFSSKDTSCRIYVLSVCRPLSYTPKGIQCDLHMGASLGVVILSAVLKRRMTLADKAKSLFISK